MFPWQLLNWEQKGSCMKSPWKPPSPCIYHLPYTLAGIQAHQISNKNVRNLEGLWSNEECLCLVQWDFPGKRKHMPKCLRTQTQKSVHAQPICKNTLKRDLKQCTSLPKAVMTKHHKLGGSKQQKSIFSHFRRLELENQCITVLVPRALRENLFPTSFLDSGSPRSSLTCKCYPLISIFT